MTATTGAAKATRKRGEALRRAVFDAVVDQLRTVGYGRTTMDGVATAAGTGKAALYRRWAGRDELVRDALSDLLPEPPPAVPGQSVRDRLVELMRYLDDALYDSKSAAFQAVAAESGSESTLLRTLFDQRVLAPVEEQIRVLVVGTGRSPDAPETVLIARTGPSVLMCDCMIARPRADRARVEELVDSVLLPLLEVHEDGQPAASTPAQRSIRSRRPASTASARSGGTAGENRNSTDSASRRSRRTPSASPTSGC